MTALMTVLAALTVLAEEVPDAEDVKAGWLGLGVFLLLAGAVVFLGFSLRKHLRKVDFEEEPDGEPGDSRPPSSV